MNSEMPDPAEPIGDIKVVKDFLPSPEQLTPKKNTVRVTMEFTRESIEYFKREAQHYNASYQAMIRNLVDAYAKNNNNKTAIGYSFKSSNHSQNNIASIEKKQLFLIAHRYSDHDGYCHHNIRSTGLLPKSQIDVLF